ncbi:hypothetical protein TIFTF001_026443 [Ficus carica]|uniref:Uncharacterized protein n=1 Tax=Ficus carica TaxID=3494 RepID=A0AA88DLE5_FICCA|nr:hypothetical protein TIFTF001_026443 [Ficus carica]
MSNLTPPIIWDHELDSTTLLLMLSPPMDACLQTLHLTPSYIPRLRSSTYSECDLPSAPTRTYSGSSKYLMTRL